ncbi:MAG: type transport system ATP-binding protein, partial [Nocardioidaceae bacterium]|nr:type transport system ATP-binding protein [Nocardioidaceae bacterium]
GTLTADQAREIAGSDTVTDDESAMTITTREPSRILTQLANRDALDGLSVSGASLEDVFLELTGREFRA